MSKLITDDQIEAINRKWNCGGNGHFDWAREIEAACVARQAELAKDAARYNWLVGKVFARGETCLTLLEEFGGAPFKGETIRQFMDRYIDAAMMPNA